MNLFNSIILLSTVTVLSSACVSRTVSIEPQHRGEIPKKGKSYGSEAQDNVIEKKIIWIWQDEFRNPK